MLLWLAGLRSRRRERDAFDVDALTAAVRALLHVLASEAHDAWALRDAQRERARATSRDVGLVGERDRAPREYRRERRIFEDDAVVGARRAGGGLQAHVEVLV